MKRMCRWGAAALLAAATVAGPAFAANVTVGRFYSEIAKAAHLNAADAATAESSLRGAGYDLPKLSLDAPLTEGSLSSISKALGVSVTTQRPSQVVDEAQMNTYMSTFGRSIGTTVGTAGAQPQPYGTGTGGTDPGNSGNGKGKKKGHNKSTSEPI